MSETKGRTMTFYLTPDAITALQKLESECDCRSRSIMMDEIIRHLAELGGIEMLRKMRYATEG